MDLPEGDAGDPGQFGVSYHPAHVSRLLKSLGLSCRNRSAERTREMSRALSAGRRSAGRL
jgi:transposase